MFFFYNTIVDNQVKSTNSFKSHQLFEFTVYGNKENIQ